MKNLIIVIGTLLLSQNAFAERCNYQCKSEKNKAAAENFCRTQVNIDCKVHPNRTCGSGWENIRKFDDGGNSYFACIKTARQENSDKNKEEALKYCSQNYAPGACSVSEGTCGRNYTSVKHFRGPGRNYSACIPSARGEASEENKQLAEQFCAKLNSAAGSLLDCKAEKRNCSGKLQNIKEFKGKGDNWAVCVVGK